LTSFPFEIFYLFSTPINELNILSLPFGGRQLLFLPDFIPIKSTHFQQKILANKFSNFFTQGSLSFSLQAMPRLRQFVVSLLTRKSGLDPSSILVPFLLEKLAMGEVCLLMKYFDVNISRVIIVYQYLFVNLPPTL